MRPHVELVSTGNELLNGRTANRHAQTLGAELAALGMTLDRDTTVPDDLAAIAAAVREALARVEVVVVTGGLGPTSDDVTRDAVAEVMGRPVVTDEESLRNLEQRRGGRGAVSEAMRRQARVVEGAVPLANPVGLAPGQRLELDGRTLFLLPGPPREFEAVLHAHVLGWLRGQYGGATKPVEQVLMTTGLPESEVVTRFEAAGFPPDGVRVAYCAAPGRVELTLRRDDGEGADLAHEVAVARRLLGVHLYAEERVELQEVVGRLLVARGQTLALAESCTGGLLAHRVTSCSGSSAYFAGGVVAYSNASKARDLDVRRATLAEHGAVSAEVAAEMAAGVRDRFNVDYGVALTGIAGPTGGTPEKPVGLVHIALADAAGTRHERHVFRGDRERVKLWSCVAGLDMLRRRLLEAG